MKEFILRKYIRERLNLYLETSKKIIKDEFKKSANIVIKDIIKKSINNDKLL